MSKKKNEVAEGQVELTLSDAQAKVWNALSAEKQQAMVDKMTGPEILEQLDAIIALDLSSSVSSDDDFVEVTNAREELTLLTAGGPGLTEGTVIEGDLLGTQHIFSKEFKENWKVKSFEAGDFYYNCYYRIALLNGKEIGIYSSPTLRKLEKLPTHASDPVTVRTNPRVRITYVGLISGRERLSKEFGIELQQGNECHVFSVKTKAGVKFNMYEAGVINSLNSPEPMVSGEKIDRDVASKIHYERMQQLTQDVQPAQITQ